MFNKGMGNIYKQAQQMQKKMSQVQEDLKNVQVEGTSGGGMVKVIVNGKKDIISIDIDKSVLKEEKEMLEDLILAAFKQAMENADRKAEEMMKAITGGTLPNFNLPGF